MANNITRILIRRGTDAQRRYQPGVVLLAGEPGFTTDSKRLFVGDGSTVGGNPVGITNLGVVSALFATPGYNSTGYDTAAYNLIYNAGVVKGDIIYDQTTSTLWSLTSVAGVVDHANFNVPYTREFVSLASLSQGGGSGGSGLNAANVTPIKFTKTGDGASVTFNLNSLSALPTDPYSYRVDINGVLQEPGVDYNINSGSLPYTITFTTAPILNEKIVILAYAPTVITSYPVLDSNSVLANTTNYTAAGTPLDVVGTNQFVGNIGAGLRAITLAAGTGMSLNPSGTTLTIAADTLQTLINTISAAVAAVSATATTGSVPVGMVSYYALSTNPPTGWIFCNGAALVLATYPQAAVFRTTLINAGYPYGGDVSSNPKVPNLPLSAGPFPVIKIF